jgi:hypothetical protein
MALVSDFPDFAAAERPSVDDLNLAAQKLTEVVGGVLPDGSIVPGGVDAANLIAIGEGISAGFVADQEAEPYSEFGVQFDAYDRATPSSSGTYAAQLGPLPMDVWLTRVCYRGDTALDGAVTLKLGGLDLLSLPLEATFRERQWPVQYMIPAGAVLLAEVVYDPADGTAQYALMLAMKALHAGGPAT